MLGYPRRFLPLLWLVLAAVLVTGLLLVPGALELRFDVSAPLQLPGGSRIGVAAVHALAAFVLLVFLGSLFTLHMRSGWRRHENRRSGLITVLILTTLVLTGLGIYYLSDESLSRWTSALHIAFGAAAAAAITVHAVLGRRVRAQRRAGLRHSRADTSEIARPVPCVAVGKSRRLRQHLKIVRRHEKV